MGILKNSIGGKPRTIAFIAIGSLVIGAYLWMVLMYTVNAPFGDDYHAILEFLANYVQEPNLLKKFLLLFSQHNEHRILIDRLAVVAQYTLFHEVNFTVLNFVGNLSLILLVVYLLRAIPSLKEENILYFLPVFFVVINFRYYEISFWAMASLQNLWVEALAVITLYYLFQPGQPAFRKAIIVGFITTFTSGNGMIVLLAGMCVLFLNEQFSKRWFIWMGVTVLGITLYFYGYHKPESNTLLHVIANDPFSIVQYALLLLGSAYPFASGENQIPAYILGSLLVFATAFFFVKKYHLKNPVIFAVMMFLLFTAMLTTIGRVGQGLGQALSYRYTIVSSIYVACFYIGLVELYLDKFRKVYILWGSLLFASLWFHNATYQRYIGVVMDAKSTFDRKIYWRDQGYYSNPGLGWPLSDKSEPLRVLRLVDSLKLYTFTIPTPIPHQSLPFCTDCKVFSAVDHFSQTEDKMEIAGWTVNQGVNPDTVMTVVQLLDSADVVIKESICETRRRDDLVNLYGSDGVDYTFSGYFCECMTGELKPGQYKTNILLANGRYKVKVDPAKQIEIK